MLQRRRRLEDEITLTESLRKKADDLAVLVDWFDQGEDVEADLLKGQYALQHDD